MTALTASRKIPSRTHRQIAIGVAATTTIYSGALVATNAAGYLVPASADTDLDVVGVAREYADNSSGANGDKSVKVDLDGVFAFKNSAGGDEIDTTHRGQIVYAVDDQTVALTSSDGTRPPAGEVVDVDDDGVWLWTGNNGSAKDSARAFLRLDVDTTLGATAAEYQLPAPFAGRIVKVWSAIDAAITGADATIGLEIDGTAVTGGSITVTQAGSAPGDVDSATPTAANTFAEGATISAQVGGGDTAGIKATLVIEVERL